MRQPKSRSHPTPAQRAGVRIATLLLIALTGAVAAEEGQGAAAESALPPGVAAFGGHHYLLVDNVKDLSWPTAKKQCEDWGAHLAVVTSAAEAEFISTLCDGQYMYLGASDEAKEGTWVWVDGSAWEFTHWYKGQPNDYAGSENYLATYDGGKWVDVDVSGDDFWMPTGYICEWDR